MSEQIKFYIRPARENQNRLERSGWDIQDFYGEVIASFQTRNEALGTARRYVREDRAA